MTATSPSYEIKASAKGAEIWLYSEIGGIGITAKQFVSDLQAHRGKALSLRINSPGGSVIDGTAIYNALLRHDGEVTVHIDGIAASMASVVAMAGKNVHMADNAFLMIHDPWSVAIGKSAEMRKTADMLDKMRGGLVDAYVRKTRKSATTIETWMSHETWFTAKEAKREGFVDNIGNACAIQNSFDVSNFRNVPRALRSILPVASSRYPSDRCPSCGGPYTVSGCKICGATPTLGGRSPASLFDEFQRSQGTATHRLLFDPITGPVIRAESARRTRLPSK
jgi:ATP-dependent Clp endopeptidase proteolytic subunit ClpP